MKVLTSVLVVCLLLTGAAWLGMPNSAEARFRGSSADPGPNYVDANNDGVCDWAQTRQGWDEATQGRYGDWVDADGDGICDNYANRPQDGTGQGYRGGR